MSKITPLMTSLHEGHKTGERLQCIDDMLFNECKDTKDTILRAFWWYRKNSIPLDKIKEAKKRIEKYEADCLVLEDRPICLECNENMFKSIYHILDELIESEN